MARPKKYDENTLLKIVDDYAETYGCIIKTTDLENYSKIRYHLDISRKAFERYPKVAERIKWHNDILTTKKIETDADAESQYSTINPVAFLNKNNTQEKLIKAIVYLDDKDRQKSRTIAELNKRVEKYRTIVGDNEEKTLKELEDQNNFLFSWIDTHINSASAMEVLRSRNFPVKSELGISKDMQLEVKHIGYLNKKDPYELSADPSIRNILTFNTDEQEGEEEFAFDPSQMLRKLETDLLGEF